MILATLVLALAWGQADASVLERTPDELTAAEIGTWADWDPLQPPTGALLELFRPSVTAYQAGDYVGALRASYALLEAHPDYPPSLHQVGVVYFRLRRYGDALHAFERMLKHAPGQLRETRALAHCYYSLGEYDRALEHYTKVLNVDPEMSEAVQGLALTQMRLGDLDAALAGLRVVLEDKPDAAEVMTWIAQILFDLEQAEEAQEYAERAKATAPFEPKAWFLLAQIHFDAGRDDEGDAHRERFLELDRIAQAVRGYEADLLLRPNDLDLLRALVAAHAEIGNVPAARSAIFRSVRSAQGKLEAWIFALNAFVEIGDEASAARAADEIATRFADSVAAWQRLERYYARIKDRVRQVQAGERVRRLGG